MSELRVGAERIIRRIQSGEAIDVVICTERLNHFDGSDIVSLVKHPGVASITFRPNLADVVKAGEHYDVALVLTHWVDEVSNLRLARSHDSADLIVLWIWDNHIAENFHRQAASLADVVIPAHAFNVGYLRCPLNIVLPAVSIPSVQWNRTTIETVFETERFGDRLDGLYGPYFTYKEYPEREFLLRKCVEENVSDAIKLRNGNDNRDNFFSTSSADRLREWMTYKTSLCLPLKHDLSSRFFDALVAGQVPIAPTRILDLDLVIDPKVQAWLPIIRFEDYTVEAVSAAYKEAMRRFDAEGATGVLRRNKYALENHLATNRLAQVFDSIMTLQSAY